MKKVLLSFAALTLSGLAMSQVRVGIKGGANFSTITVDNSGSTQKARMLPGYHVGIIADFPLVPQILSFQPGFYYSTKGSKIEYGDKGNPTLAKPFTRLSTTPGYLEVPLNFVFKIPMGDHARLFAGIGPYFAYGISGKNKIDVQTSESTTISTSDKINWDDDTPVTAGASVGAGKRARFDWGGNLMAGAEIYNFIISAQYGLGMGKINSGGNSSTDEKNKNRVFSVSVGYLFGKK